MPYLKQNFKQFSRLSAPFDFIVQNIQKGYGKFLSIWYGKSGNYLL